MVLPLLLSRAPRATSRMLIGAVLALAALVPGSGHAQTPARAPLVLGIDGSTRAMGLGGAFQPGEGDPDAVFVNPALAALAGGFSLGWHRFDTESTALTLSTAREWYGGGIFGGVQVLDWGGGEGPGTYAGGVDGLTREGGAGAADVALSLGYGRSLFGLRAGITGKYLLQRAGASNAATMAVDVGLARRLGPGWIHLAGRNLGAPTTWGTREVDLPTEVGLGWGSYGRPLGPLDVGAAAEVTRRADGEVIFGGGLEFGYWPLRGRTFVARVGARSIPEGDASPLTLGGSYWGDDLVLDYAYQPVEGTDGIHRITLGWR